MIFERSKGSQRNLFEHELPQDKILFWDTNFVIASLFPPSAERLELLRTKATTTPLTPDELRERGGLQYLTRRHRAAAIFMERLITSEMNVAFSTILFTEVYFTIEYFELKKVFGSKERTREELRINPKILIPHIPEIVKNWTLFLELLSNFPGRVFTINPAESGIIQEALRVRTQYLLSPNDSLHLATLLAGQRQNFVAFDRDLTNAAIDEGVHVWCNIFQKKDPGAAQTPGLADRPK